VPPRAPARKLAPAASPPPPEPPRRNYAARGIAGLLAPVIRPAFRRRAPAAAQLLADWDMLAGPDFATRAQPVKFAGGTLTLACTGPVAMELQYRAPALIARLNLALGHNTVERLRFVQQTLATPTLTATTRRRATPPPVNLPDGELGEALATLYKGLSTRA
jgi:hypothetical protein